MPDEPGSENGDSEKLGKPLDPSELDRRLKAAGPKDDPVAEAKRAAIREQFRQEQMGRGKRQEEKHFGDREAFLQEHPEVLEQSKKNSSDDSF